MGSGKSSLISAILGQVRPASIRNIFSQFCIINSIKICLMELISFKDYRYTFDVMFHIKNKLFKVILVLEKHVELGKNLKYWRTWSLGWEVAMKLVNQN